MTVFSSVLEGRSLPDPEICSVPESCKNHPAKSRPYSRSDTRARVKRLHRTLQMGPDRVPLSQFSCRRNLMISSHSPGLMTSRTSETYAHRSCQTCECPGSPTEKRSVQGVCPSLWESWPGWNLVRECVKQAFFSSGHAVQFSLSFATGKRMKAFYSATENAPFALNPAYLAFSGKMCRNGVIFASNSGKGVSGGAIRGCSGAGLGGRGFCLMM